MTLKIPANRNKLLMKKPPIYIFIIVIALSFFSCKKSTVTRLSTRILKKGINQNAKQINSDSLNAYCFYMLDDKYASSTQSQEIDDWLKEKQKAIENKTLDYNLFDKNGGGPNGAEWNPSTNLYLAIVCPVNELNNNIELSINGTSYSNQMFLKDKNVSWYIIKQDFWEENLKEVNEEKVLEFKIEFNNLTTKKYFYAAYGE